MLKNRNKMKIAFFVGEFPKLSESFVLSQITGLMDRGHEVVIFAGVHPKQPKVHPDVARYHLLEKTYYPEDIIPRSIIKRASKAFHILRTNFNGNRNKVFKTLNFLKYGKKALGFTYLFYLAYFLEEEFDVIHAHFGPNGLRALFLKEILDKKLVTTFHGYDVFCPEETDHGKRYKNLFDQGSLFTYNSEATRKKLRSFNCPEKLMMKLPMGINLDKFNFRERRRNLGRNINILSVGRLIEMKGHEYAIKAVARVIQKYPKVNYYIAGDGHFRNRLSRLIEDLGVEDNVKLLGFVSESELQGLYRTAHIYIHPSVKVADGNMEGQGVALLEAQACGLPVIATRHNALPESVLEGESAFLVPERDVAAIAERLTFLIENSKLWPKIGRAGRRFVEGKFNIEQLNKDLEEMYKLCLKSV